MKNLIATIAILMSMTSNARSLDPRFVDLKDGDIRLTDAHVELVDVSEICPKTPGGISCMAIGAHATLKITLNGCVDHLGPVFHKIVVDKDYNAKLIVSAVNIHNEASRRVRCFAPNIVTKKIFIPQGGPLELEQVRMMPNYDMPAHPHRVEPLINYPVELE